MSHAKEYNAAGEIGQAHRFAGVIHEVGNWEGKRVLDVGCACGDLYPLLHAQGISQYLGLDINEEYIKIARERFSGPNVGFMPGTVENGDYLWGQWDIVVAIEVLWTPDVNEDRFAAFMRNCWQCTKNTLAVTVQSMVAGPFERHEGFAMGPQELMHYCRKLSHKFKISHHEWWETGQIAVVRR